MIIKGSKEAKKKMDNATYDTKVKTMTEGQTTDRVKSDKYFIVGLKYKLEDKVFYDFFCKKLVESIFVVIGTGLAMEWSILSTIVKKSVLYFCPFLAIAALTLAKLLNGPKFQHVSSCFYFQKLVNFAFVTSLHILFGTFGPKIYSGLRPCFAVYASLVSTFIYGFLLCLSLSNIIGQHSKRLGFWLYGLVMPMVAMITIQTLYFYYSRDAKSLDELDYTGVIANYIFAISFSFVVCTITISYFKKFLSSNKMDEFINRQVLYKLPMDTELSDKKQGTEIV